MTGTRRIRYTRDVLEAIAENMNRRISDTGDFTPICAGHTPTDDERRRGVPMPDLVGFSGPFYVGMLGGDNPRPAIYAKNWAIFRDEVDRARKLPRRSVEVWREENPRDRYFDPIALLGARRRAATWAWHIPVATQTSASRAIPAWRRTGHLLRRRDT